MIDRKKKLRFVQLFLLIFSLLIIYLTYYNRSNDAQNEIISKSIKEKVEKQSQSKLSEVDSDVFFNIEYTGLDLNGNRYILKSEEAYLDETKPEVVYMKVVNAVFYFKDNTVLTIWSKKGIYNNKTLDMKFEDEVRAEYLESKLFAGKANYSNSENYLSIFENVKINDINGNLIADKLLFDISKQKLDITSFNNGKINANLNLNEKRF
tara:strand:+ start:371 stop:994 length:624 start_codon:yes stop_codon:yes gene_type:complete